MLMNSLKLITTCIKRFDKIRMKIVQFEIRNGFANRTRGNQAHKKIFNAHITNYTFSVMPIVKHGFMHNLCL